MTVNQLAWLCRIAVGCVFLFFGIPKVLNPVDFARSIHLYQLLPGWGVGLVAITLPWMEIVAAWVLLFGRRMADGAAALLFLMLMLFNAAMISAMARGLNIDCGCSGPVSAPVGLDSLLRNLALGLLCAFILYALARRSRIGRGISSTRTPAPPSP